MARITHNRDGTYSFKVSKAIHNEWNALEADTLEEDDRDSSKARFVHALNTAKPSGGMMTMRVDRDALKYMSRPAGPIGNAVDIWRESPTIPRGQALSWIRSVQPLQDEAHSISSHGYKPLGERAGDSSDEHADAANIHRTQAINARKSGSADVASKHQEAARAHDEAARAFLRRDPELQDKIHEARQASRRANDAEDAAKSKKGDLTWDRSHNRLTSREDNGSWTIDKIGSQWELKHYGEPITKTATLENAQKIAAGYAREQADEDRRTSHFAPRVSLSSERIREARDLAEMHLQFESEVNDPKASNLHTKAYNLLTSDKPEDIAKGFEVSHEAMTSPGHLKQYPGPGEPADHPDVVRHKDMAQAHMEAADKAPTPQQKDAHLNAAQAHNYAARTTAIAKATGDVGDEKTAIEQTRIAAMRSAAAPALETGPRGGIFKRAPGTGTKEYVKR